MGVRHGCPTLQASLRLHLSHVCAAQDAVPDACYAALAEQVPTSNLHSIIEKRFAPANGRYGWATRRMSS